MNTSLKSRVATVAMAMAFSIGQSSAQSAAPGAAPPTQGVMGDQIVLGTIQDLSGPAAALGKHALAGMRMRVDQINAAGGIHGRKLLLRAEDSVYDPRQAVLAAQKLLQQDRIFAMVGHFGTANNMAAMPLQFERGVVNFMPVAPAREMYEPPHALKFATLVSGHEQMRHAVPRLMTEKKAERACILYQDDEFGLEVLRGTEAALTAMNRTLTERSSYKRGATDFASQMARLKAANCDLVVLGTVVRETIGAVVTSRAMGFAPTFLVNMAGYTDLIHRLGGGAMEGLYAAMAHEFPYPDSPSAAVREWAAAYKARTGEDPNGTSAVGWQIIDILARALERAGPQLTSAELLEAMNGLAYDDPLFGAPPQRWSATQRLGSDAVRLARIEGGRWRVASEYFNGQ